jgi:uncharacterized iron-regulated membrane protein
MDHMMPGVADAAGYDALNRLVPAAQNLHLAYPVLVMPPMTAGGPWTVKSDAQNRPLRTVVMMDPASTRIVQQEDFSHRRLIDRVLGVGIAAHEGQLFGIANQILSVTTAMGLVTLCISAVVLWWRRRSTGVLGAPVPMAKPRWPLAVVGTIVALALYLPAMAASLVVVVLLERFVFSRIHPVRRWLGLAEA